MWYQMVLNVKFTSKIYESEPNSYKMGFTTSSIADLCLHSLWHCVPNVSQKSKILHIFQLKEMSDRTSEENIQKISGKEVGKDYSDTERKPTKLEKRNEKGFRPHKIETENVWFSYNGRT